MLKGNTETGIKEETPLFGRRGTGYEINYE